MATSEDSLEKKVERVFSDEENRKVDGILYRELDFGGMTTQFLLHIVSSGVIISDKNIEPLMEYMEKHGPRGNA